MILLSIPSKSPLSGLKDSFSHLAENFFKQNEQAILENIRTRMRSKLLETANNWTPSDKVLEKYPFMHRFPGCLDTYINALRVKTDAGSMQLTFGFDAEVLQRAGLPESLGTLLEYGDDLIRPFPHFRTADAYLTELLGSLLREMRVVQ